MYQSIIIRINHPESEKVRQDNIILKMKDDLKKLKIKDDSFRHTSFRTMFFFEKKGLLVKVKKIGEIDTSDLDVVLEVVKKALDD